ncbi:pilus assembly protein PilM [Candidatus Roizmanbacteria bacterium]|nr:pilus assembly protein PilM [Candidatus Roizmanbacteria bacterium]
MVDDLICLNLEENILRVAKASNAEGKINIDILAYQSDLPAFFESDTQKVFNDEALLLKKLIDNLKLRKKPVDIVIPDGFTYSQILYMPRLKEKELLSAIKYQADQFIPMSIEDTSLDLEILYEDKLANNLLVLIVAAPQNLIERIQRLAEQVGLFPESIENELSATGRFLANFYNPPSPEGGSIFINLGYSSTNFYFFDHKLKLFMDSHSFQAGLSVFLREAQADINVDLAKAKDLLKRIGFSQDSSVDLIQILQPAVDVLCSELQKFINSVRTKFQTSSISRIYLFNLANEINLIDKTIEKSISIPSAIFDPLPITKKTSSIEPFIRDLPSFIPAIGGCLE